MVIIHKPDR